MRLRDLKRFNKLATPENLKALEQRAKQYKAAADQCADHGVTEFVDVVSRTPAKAPLKHEVGPATAATAALGNGAKGYSTLAGKEVPKQLRSAFPYPPKPSTFADIDARIAEMTIQVARRQQILGDKS